MRNSFDLLNDIFNWCVADEEMMRMLGVMDNTNTDVLKDKLRLECQADEAVTAAAVPFIAFYFTRAEKLEHNWLVNKGELYVDFYADALLNAGLLAKRFRQVLGEHDEILLSEEGQQSIGADGVYKYRLIYSPLIDGK
ncbi:hypothetical protein [uncultured Phascolarctobacterium sp.]|uniref:hypothetical protein n=1 Tax=uncultured Phascolarctobacterium sp. TaxID=512296 RepID=UPI00262864ED|nr:hypothetical protein [uncultured Phascolarctobacterium sp.]